MTPDTIDQLIAQLNFNEQGLVPAIAQETDTGAVLMMAWMNEDAVRATLRTGEITYWSRSRSELWRKGATSGHSQKLKDFRIDCDGDTILLQVEQRGPACHTGERTCFFRSASEGGLAMIPSEKQGPK